MTKYYYVSAHTIFCNCESFYTSIEGEAESECIGKLMGRLPSYGNAVSDKYFNMNKLRAFHLTDEEYYATTQVYYWEVHRLEYEQGIMNLAKRGEENGT